MGLSVNKAIIAGYLSSEVILGHTSKGIPYATFQVCTSETVKNKKVEDYHRVTVWRKRGEACAQYLVKGQLVAVEGRISYSKYTKDGTTYHSCEIIAERVSFGPRSRRKDPEIEW